MISLLLVGRLAHVQLFQHSYYSALAEDQHWIVQDLPSARGRILSSDGAILASNQLHYLLYAEPVRIQSKHLLANELAAILSSLGFGEEVELRDKYYELIDNDLWWIALEKEIDPRTKEILQKSNLEGIGFEPSPVRYYPEGALAGHVLGFLAYNEKGDRVGYFGVEGGLDGELRGRPGKVIQERDARGRPILMGGHSQIDPIQGWDVTLTIDRSVQYLVERGLKEGVERYGAASGTIIVMDPHTAAIIAMANYPEFNPSDFKSELDAKNIAIADIYEPGSVMKPFTVAAALDVGSITPSTTFEDYGPVTYSGHIVDNWDGRHYGIQDMGELLRISNNIGAAWVGHRIGSEKLYDYLVSFGFGSKYDLTLEGEDTGTLRHHSSWIDIDLANISFGQGMSASALQVLNGFNAFANGGFIHRPRIVSQISTDRGTIEISDLSTESILSEETLQDMHNLLIAGVSQEEYGHPNLKGYKIAGKSGTAQVPIEGGYDPSITNATFIGYLAESKVFTMLVRLENPQSSPYAAETSYPLWVDMAKQLVNYYGIPPDF